MKCKSLVIFLGVLIGVFPNFVLASDDSSDAVRDAQPATRVVVIPLDLGGQQRINCSDCDGYFAPEPHDHHDWYYTKPELRTSGGGGQVHWNNLTNRPSGLDDGDDNTTYSPGVGLNLVGTEFSVNTSTIQARVSSSCTAGSSIRQVNADGTVVCETDNDTTDHGSLSGLGDDDHPQYFHLTQNETVDGRPAFNGGDSGSTPPFSVDSTYRVANLNADMVDGLEANAFWNLSGNAGVITGTHFLGTTDNKALDFRVNNARALRLEPHATSPNVIGGYSDNSVSAGVYGATISGGGAIGAGHVVSGNYATVGGGYANAAIGLRATVGGGYVNTASAEDATVSGGHGNTASGEDATVSGGLVNTASSDSATVGGGYNNEASNYYATVGGGGSNTAGAFSATVGGGGSNTAAAGAATVGGGASNTASATYATVPGGGHAIASHYGEMAYASGRFANDGDAQTSLYVLRNTTSSITPAELFLDGSSQRLTIGSNRVMTFDILVVATEPSGGGGDSAGYQIKGVIENIGGTTAFVGGTPTPTVLGRDDFHWGISVIADDTNDALVIEVNGWADTTIRWVASVRTVEVAR